MDGITDTTAPDPSISAIFPWSFHHAAEVQRPMATRRKKQRRCSAHRLPIATSHHTQDQRGRGDEIAKVAVYDVDRYLSACHDKVKAVTVGGVEGGKEKGE